MKKGGRAATADASIRPSVYIIDDDASVRTALGRLLVSAGIPSRSFGSAADFLKANPPPDGACVVTDVRMPGMTGLELHEALHRAGSRLAVIFVTAYDTDEARAQAKKAGAVAYFRKPVDDQALLDAIHWALSREEGDA